MPSRDVAPDLFRADPVPVSVGVQIPGSFWIPHESDFWSRLQMDMQQKMATLYSGAGKTAGTGATEKKAATTKKA